MSNQDVVPEGFEELLERAFEDQEETSSEKK